MPAKQKKPVYRCVRKIRDPDYTSSPSQPRCLVSWEKWTFHAPSGKEFSQMVVHNNACAEVSVTTRPSSVIVKAPMDGCVVILFLQDARDNSRPNEFEVWRYRETHWLYVECNDQTNDVFTSGDFWPEELIKLRDIDPQGIPFQEFKGVVLKP